MTRSKTVSRIPLWAEAIRDHTQACLPAAAVEANVKAELEQSRRPPNEVAAEVRSRFELALAFLPEHERQQLAWLEANAAPQLDELAQGLPAKHWDYLRVRFSERVLREATTMGLSGVSLYDRAMREHTNLTQLAFGIRGMAERLLGTDAMLNRPRVRYSIKRVSMDMGDLAGSWVGGAIHSNSPLSQIFHSLAFVFAIDAWRFWAMADEWVGYDFSKDDSGTRTPAHAKEDWFLFLKQLAYCRIAHDAAVDAATAERAGNSFDDLRAALVKRHRGEPVAELLLTVWTDFRAATHKGTDKALSIWSWHDVLSAHIALRRAVTGILFCEELAWMHAARKFKHVRPPKWSAARAERWWWAQAGKDIEHREWKKIFG